MQTVSMKPFVLAGVGITALVLAYKKNTGNIQETTEKLKEKIMPSRYDDADVVPVAKAGNPDPNDLEDNKMVSEGSMYGVNYYNEQEQ